MIGSFIFVENNRTSVKNKLYAEIFEKPFLKATREYYSGQAKILLDQNDCSTYMEKVLALMEIESDRLKDLIPESSHRKLIKEFESCMVGEHMDFLQIECRSMVENEKRRDLHNMYRLMMPIDSGLKALVGQVEAHIKQKGLQTIRCLNPKEENYVRSFVENMLKVYDHYLHLIEDVFESHKDFVTALDMACTEVINHREDNRAPCRSPEILSRYFDNLLKKSSRMSCETEIEEKLSSAIQIFKYINDKDVFQKFYAKMLAKRLIYAQYMSLDMEEMMINKLKQACGYEFTSKLHRMFTDIKSEYNFILISKNIIDWFYFSLWRFESSVYWKVESKQDKASDCILDLRATSLCLANEPEFNLDIYDTASDGTFGDWVWKILCR